MYSLSCSPIVIVIVVMTIVSVVNSWSDGHKPSPTQSESGRRSMKALEGYYQLLGVSSSAKISEVTP